MSEFYSHSEEVNGEIKGTKLLKDHLKEVGELAFRFASEYPKNSDLAQILAQIAKFIGLTHDFGKYTSFFQDRLLKRKKRGVEADHGFISAIFTSWVLSKKILSKNLGSSISSSLPSEYIPLIGYLTVLHHHGNIGDVEDNIPQEGDVEDNIPQENEIGSPKFSKVSDQNLREKLKALQEQIEDLNENASQIETELKEIGINFKISEFKNECFEQLRKLRKLVDRYEKEENEETKINTSFFFLFLYSCLIDADKRDAGDVPEITRKEIPCNLVDEYEREKFKGFESNSLNEIREEIYKKVMSKLNPSILSNNIFAITAPTGTGKTLTGFSFALKLRELIRKEKNYTPRIIYSLPYINIIEQNYSVIEEVLKLIPDYNQNSSSYLLKHHHLSEVEYKTDDKELPVDKALFLTESWEAEVIITTFVQFFYSIIGYKNSFLKKFHNIMGSIIILDEVQNIPVEYWNLVKKVLKSLTSIFGCYIVLMTATKPLIFIEGEYKELVDEYEEYFKRFKRTKIESMNLEERTIDEIVEIFKERYTKEKSYLIVLNTISSSVNVYEKIRKELNLQPCSAIEECLSEEIRKESDFPLYSAIEKCLSELSEKQFIFYLSSNIIPKQRDIRIKILKKMLSKGLKPVLVSTQVVEAGVDLSFDEVWRDLGPIDSIIQIAGRCNRNCERNIGDVKIVNTGKHLIYGKIAPYISKQILNGKCIDEEYYIKIINEYFEKLKEKKDVSESKEVWEGILNLEFSKVTKFRLIRDEKTNRDEEINIFNIFVEYDEVAKSVWEKYKNLYKEKNFIERRKKFLEIKKDFFTYLLSIPIERVKKNLPSEECGIIFIPKEQLTYYYDPDTGFKTEQETLIL